MTNKFFSWILQLRFIDTVVERQPKLRRQRCIFTKERGNDKLFVVLVLPLCSSLICVMPVFNLIFNLVVCVIVVFLREELSQSSPDEHEFCHLGSPDDEHPPSLQFLHHVQLVLLHTPRPCGRHHPSSNCEAASNPQSSAKVRNNPHTISTIT